MIYRKKQGKSRRGNKKTEFLLPASTPCKRYFISGIWLQLFVSIMQGSHGVLQVENFSVIFRNSHKRPKTQIEIIEELGFASIRSLNLIRNEGNIRYDLSFTRPSSLKSRLRLARSVNRCFRSMHPPTKNQTVVIMPTANGMISMVSR